MDAPTIATPKHSLSDLPPDLQYAVKVMVDVMTDQVVKPLIKESEARFDRRVDESTQWHQSQFKSADTHLDHALGQMKDAKRNLEATANKVNDAMLGAQSRLGSLETGHLSQDREISRLLAITEAHDRRLHSLEVGQGIIELSQKNLRDDLYGSVDRPGEKSIMSRFDDFDKKFDIFKDEIGKQLSSTNQSVQEHERYISNRKRMEAILFTGWTQIWNNKLIILWVLTILSLIIFSLFGVKWLQP